MDNKIEKAKELFASGYNCAQAVFAAYAEEYGFSKEQALKVSSALGGGIGCMRETCGAFGGLALLVGLENGATEGKDNESKQKTYRIVQELAAKFKAEHKSLICAELKCLRENNSGITKPSACPLLVESAARIWEEYKSTLK